MGGGPTILYYHHVTKFYWQQIFVLAWRWILQPETCSYLKKKIYVVFCLQICYLLLGLRTQQDVFYVNYWKLLSQKIMNSGGITSGHLSFCYILAKLLNIFINSHSTLHGSNEKIFSKHYASLSLGYKIPWTYLLHPQQNITHISYSVFVTYNSSFKS